MRERAISKLLLFLGRTTDDNRVLIIQSGTVDKKIVRPNIWEMNSSVCELSGPFVSRPKSTYNDSWRVISILYF